MAGRAACVARELRPATKNGCPPEGTIVVDFHNFQITWRKSGASGSGDCVEVATPPHSVLMRDSKDRSGPTISFTDEAWKTFLLELRFGRIRP